MWLTRLPVWQNSLAFSVCAYLQIRLFRRESSFFVTFQLDTSDEIRKMENQLVKKVSDTNATLHRINAPNMKAMEK